MVKVSVIIPNYNRQDIIGETINNILSQSLMPHEVIVIDDGSTDNSINVLKSFGDRLTIIQQENKGPGAARNQGIQIATGDFIQFMDSDDLTSLNKLEYQANELIEHDADIVYGPWLKTFICEHRLQLKNVVLQQNSIPKNKNIIASFLTGWSLVFQSCLFRTDFIKKVGLYRTDMLTGEDSEFFFRMLLQSSKIIYESKTLTLYRLNDYGKLTASGSQSIGRVTDWARFQTIVIELCTHSQELYPFIQHPKFLVDVWKTYRLIKQYDSSNIEISAILRKFLENSSYYNYLPLISRTFEIKSGLQERILGHRWNSDYQVNKISSEQESMIKELGFDLVFID